MPRMNLYLSTEDQEILKQAQEITGEKPSPTIQKALREFVERNEKTTPPTNVPKFLQEMVQKGGKPQDE